MPEVVDLDALEANGGLVDLDADPEFANPAAADPFGYKRTGTALAKGAGEAVANLGRLAQRGMAAGGIRTGDPIPESIDVLEVPPEQEFAKGVGKFAATLPLAGPGGAWAQTARGAASGAMMTGDLPGIATGAAGGALLHGAGEAFGAARRLGSALAADDAAMGVLEKAPGIGQAINLARALKVIRAKMAKLPAQKTSDTAFAAEMAEREALRKPIEEARAAAAAAESAAPVPAAAAKTVTGGEKAAALAEAPTAAPSIDRGGATATAGRAAKVLSKKRQSEAAHKAAVSASRVGPRLDEVTPELVRTQGIMVAQKKLSDALAKGDMKTARAVLEKINKEYGVKLNLRELAKGKKP